MNQGSSVAHAGLSRVPEHMDGVRGVLVSAVVLMHVFYLSVLVRGQQPWYNRMTLWFHPVLSVVGLFVVISGYCLMLPVAHANDRSLRGGIAGYLHRRLWRILPPYYAASLLSLLHLTLMKSTYSRLDLAADPWHAGTLWSHIFLFYNWNPAWRYQINPPLWSLPAEWQLYLLFPVALVPLWKKFGLGVLLGTALAATCAAMLSGDAVRQMHPWYLLLFTAGMGGAVATSSTDPSYVARRDRIPWSKILCALMAAFIVEWSAMLIWRPGTFMFLPLGWQQYSFVEIILGFALLASILHWNKAQRTSPIHEWPWVLRLLHGTPLKWLGSISYSLYLVHWPVLVTIISVIRSLHLQELPTLLLAYLCATPLTVAVGYFFFLAVERRFLPRYAKAALPAA